MAIQILTPHGKKVQLNGSMVVVGRVVAPVEAMGDKDHYKAKCAELEEIVE